MNTTDEDAMDPGRRADEAEARRRRCRLARQRGGAGPSAPPSPPPSPPPAVRLLTEDEARDLARTNTPVPAASRLPEGWVTNRVHVPFAQRLAGQARLDYAAACMQGMPPEAQDDPQFEPNSPYWYDQIEVEY